MKNYDLPGKPPETRLYQMMVYTEELDSLEDMPFDAKETVEFVLNGNDKVGKVLSETQLLIARRYFIEGIDLKPFAAELFPELNAEYRKDKLNTAIYRIVRKLACDPYFGTLLYFGLEAEKQIDVENEKYLAAQRTFYDRKKEIFKKTRNCSADEILDRLTLEFCPYCENEVVIFAEGVTACPECGTPLAPCSVCEECKTECPYGCTGGLEDEFKPVTNRAVTQTETELFLSKY